MLGTSKHRYSTVTPWRKELVTKFFPKESERLSPAELEVHGLSLGGEGFRDATVELGKLVHVLIGAMLAVSRPPVILEYPLEHRGQAIELSSMFHRGDLHVGRTLGARHPDPRLMDNLLQTCVRVTTIVSPQLRAVADDPFRVSPRAKLRRFLRPALARHLVAGSPSGSRRHPGSQTCRRNCS